VPTSWLKSASILKRLFSTEDAQDKIVLNQVIRDSDPNFIRWALGAILQWKNETVPNPYWHIHGTDDRILPMRFTKPTHIIQNAGHLMVMSKANELNKILESVKGL
jgi:pimeloyl-ACP methyl ester carboxylesterase